MPQSFQSKAGQQETKTQHRTRGKPWRRFAIKLLLNTILLGSFSEDVVASAAVRESPLVFAFRSRC